MNTRARLGEIGRSIAPALLKAVLGLGIFIGLVVLVLETNVFGAYLPVFLIVAVVVPLIAVGAILRRPTQLVATSTGIRFGSGGVVPWDEIAAIYVPTDRKHVIDATAVAARQPEARDSTVTVPFFGYQSRRLLKSPKPMLYVTFGRWWTRYRLPFRIAFANNTNQYVAGTRRGWRPASLDIAIWIDIEPRQLHGLVAQLEGLRWRASAMPVAFAVQS